ncbi:MAG: hypothetical protein QXV04_03465, partial [Desulfurococcaceae archaeon]
MLGLIMLSIAVAITNISDILTDILAIAVARISAVELGLFNSLGYLAYIVSMYIGSNLSDRGIIKVQLIAVLALLTMYNILIHSFISTASVLILALTYLLYGSAQATIRTATYAYVHESYTSSAWKSVLLQRSLMTILCEAFMLISISAIGVERVIGNIFYFSAISLLVAGFTALLVREPAVKFERALYRIDLGVRRIEDIVNNISVYTLLSSSPNAPSIYKASLRSKLARKATSLSAVIFALIGFKVANSMTLTPVPIYFNNMLGLSLSAVLGIYGVARFVPLVSLLPIKGSSKFLPFLFVARALVPFLLLAPGINGLFVGILLGF